jgi:hypothetical protein
MTNAKRKKSMIELSPMDFTNYFVAVSEAVIRTLETCMKTSDNFQLDRNFVARNFVKSLAVMVEDNDFTNYKFRELLAKQD